MQNKNEWNENKIIIGDLNFTVDKIDSDVENKTERLCRCCSNCALWKLIEENGIEDLWRRKNPDSPKFTCCDSPLPRIQDTQGLYWDLYW